MRKWTKEQEKYLIKIYKGKNNDDIAELINKKFGTSYTTDSINCKKHNMKLRSQPPKKRYKYTTKVIDFIIENYKDKDNIELANLVNKKFNLNTNGDKICMLKANLIRRYGINLRTGINRGCFKKGNVPVNKGTKGMFNVGGNRTSFKKGDIPQNHREVGSRRINVYGYHEIKVAEPNKWQLEHRVIYEKAHGTIPKGSKIIFADGNKDNLNLDNLVLVSSSEELILNRKRLLTNDQEITKTGVLIVKVIDKTNKVKNERL
jgi:hypothetical protein